MFSPPSLGRLFPYDEPLRLLRLAEQGEFGLKVLRCLQLDKSVFPLLPGDDRLTISAEFSRKLSNPMPN